jgi:hypothetical protein
MNIKKRHRSDPRIQHFKLNTDPDPIRIQGFNDQKFKKITAKKIVGIKNYNLPIPSLHKQRPSHRRSRQHSKRPSNTSKHGIFFFLLLLWVIFGLLNPDPDPQPCLKEDPDKHTNYVRYLTRTCLRPLVR